MKDPISLKNNSIFQLLVVIQNNAGQWFCQWLEFPIIAHTEHLTFNPNVAFGLACLEPKIANFIQNS